MSKRRRRGRDEQRRLIQEWDESGESAAAFAAPVPNAFLAHRHPPPLDHIPHLYYCDAIEGKDALGRVIEPGFCIDISATLDRKTEMLCCHASQREWLLKHHGIDEYVSTMRTWATERGLDTAVRFIATLLSRWGVEHG